MTGFGRLVKQAIALPLVVSSSRCEKGERITRHMCYTRLRGLVDAIGPVKSSSNVLSISGSGYLCSILGMDEAQVVDASYPEYDLGNLAIESGSFDFVVADQVLEHVAAGPERAIQEMRRVLVPGGVMICTSVFVYPIHGYPSDYWRCSPEALRHLSRDFTRVLECGGWGNMYIWFLAWLGIHQLPVPKCTWHPIRKVAELNDPNWPLAVWVVARK